MPGPPGRPSASPLHTTSNRAAHCRSPCLSRSLCTTVHSEARPLESVPGMSRLHADTWALMVSTLVPGTGSSFLQPPSGGQGGGSCLLGPAHSQTNGTRASLQGLVAAAVAPMALPHGQDGPGRPGVSAIRLLLEYPGLFLLVSPSS